MADNTKIEWTDATWNIITGCTVTSPGCTNCYAMKLAGTRLAQHPSRKGLTKVVNGSHVWTGEVRFNEDWLYQPLRWTKPRMIFVCAHGDPFHESVPRAWLDRIFAVMAVAGRHTFQVLTKRSARMRAYSNDPSTPVRVAAALVEMALDDEITGLQLLSALAPRAEDSDPNIVRWPLPNVWMGVSAEDQKRWDERIPDLRRTTAAVRWVSAEPLLGLIDGRGDMIDLDWIVAGGESGPRPMHPDWARALRDQCAAAGVPFFFKQWGGWLPWSPGAPPEWESQSGRREDHHALFPTSLDCDPNWDDGIWAVPEHEHFAFQRVGKAKAGRLLDGIEHNGFPAAVGERLL